MMSIWFAFALASFAMGGGSRGERDIHFEVNVVAARKTVVYEYSAVNPLMQFQAGPDGCAAVRSIRPEYVHLQLKLRKWRDVDADHIRRRQERQNVIVEEHAQWVRRIQEEHVREILGKKSGHHGLKSDQLKLEFQQRQLDERTRASIQEEEDKKELLNVEATHNAQMSIKILKVVISFPDSKANTTSLTIAYLERVDAEMICAKGYSQIWNDADCLQYKLIPSEGIDIPSDSCHWLSRGAISVAHLDGTPVNSDRWEEFVIILGVE